MNDDKGLILSEGYKTLVEDSTAELNRLLNIVSKAIRIEMTENGIKVINDLSKDELCALAMRIPAECAYVQTKLNDVSMEQVIEGISLESEMNNEFSASCEGKKTIKEKQAAAELKLSDKLMISAAKKQVIRNIQQVIDRADKVYEGIKKVMDLYNRDAWINKKG